MSLDRLLEGWAQQQRLSCEISQSLLNRGADLKPTDRILLCFCQRLTTVMQECCQRNPNLVGKCQEFTAFTVKDRIQTLIEGAGRLSNS